YTEDRKSVDSLIAARRLNSALTRPTTSCWPRPISGTAEKQMRVTCPLCGERDRREYTYQGDAIAISRPEQGADLTEWDAYLHLRDNPAGETRDLWYHDPCGTWVTVTRNTVTHAILATEATEGSPR